MKAAVMFTRFFQWLGRILEQEAHPITRSLGDGMRFLMMALAVGVVAIAASYVAADDYGLQEIAANGATALVAGFVGRMLKG